MVMANKMENAIELLADVVTGTNQCTPRTEALDIESWAMMAIAKEEGFSDDDLAIAGMVMENNPSRANMYLSLPTQEVHTKYIRRQMNKIEEE